MEDAIDELGRLIDTIDNYAMYTQDQPFSVQIRLDALKNGLEAIRSVVFKVYADLGGEDVWS